MQASFKRIIKIIAFTLVLVVIYVIYTSDTTIVISARSARKIKNDTKFVLYWTTFWGHADYEMGFGFEPFKECEYRDCYTTGDRGFMPLEKFDALIFHATTYQKSLHGVPEIRLPHQRYIWMNVEAPLYITPELKQYGGYFNWTMTYRFDSDIVRRHGDVVKGKTNYTMPTRGIKSKTKLATWFASNCNTPGKRERLTDEIRKYMDVDVYGSCGSLECERNPQDPKLSSKKCYDMVEEKYKFYFSFENSYCRDYSTEKLYNILQKNVVPIVYGAGDYKLSAPPNSVINVEDYTNAQDLAKYLLVLDKYDEEYLKYFEWKKKYTVIRPSRAMACQLCKKLHQPMKVSIYDNLHEWWWGINKSECRSDKNLPKIVSSTIA